MITIPHDTVVVHLSTWLYRLRMAEAQVSACQDTLAGASLDFTRDLLVDLIGATEDAATFLATELRELEAETDLGQEHVRGQHTSGC